MRRQRGRIEADLLGSILLVVVPVLLVVGAVFLMRGIAAVVNAQTADEGIHPLVIGLVLLTVGVFAIWWI